MAKIKLDKMESGKSANMPFVCERKDCSLYTSVLYSKCALNRECFQECKESGYIKHYERGIHV